MPELKGAEALKRALQEVIREALAAEFQRHRSHLLGRFSDGLTSRNDMMAWITEVVNHGIRRPGTEVGHRVEEWVASRLRYLGL